MLYSKIGTYTTTLIGMRNENNIFIQKKCCSSTRLVSFIQIIFQFSLNESVQGKNETVRRKMNSIRSRVKKNPIVT